MDRLWIFKLEMLVHRADLTTANRALANLIIQLDSDGEGFQSIFLSRLSDLTSGNNKLSGVILVRSLFKRSISSNSETLKTLYR